MRTLPRVAAVLAIALVVGSLHLSRAVPTFVGLYRGEGDDFMELRPDRTARRMAPNSEDGPLRIFWQGTWRPSGGFVVFEGPETAGGIWYRIGDRRIDYAGNTTIDGDFEPVSSSYAFVRVEAAR